MKTFARWALLTGAVLAGFVCVCCPYCRMHLGQKKKSSALSSPG